MKNVFKNRGLGFYMNLIAGATALLGAVLYIVLDGTDKTFTFIGFALALAGALGETPPDGSLAGSP